MCTIFETSWMGTSPFHEQLASISYPSFHSSFCEDLKNGTKSEEDIHDLNHKQDWVTDDLLIELRKNFPRSSDIDKSSGKHDKSAFQAACKTVFFKDRCFANSIQLNQFAKIFLAEWAVSKASHGKKICCSYGVQHRKPRIPKSNCRTPTVIS